MKIPKSLKIGPYTYPVRVKKKVRGDNGGDLWGYISHNGQYIDVQKGLSPERTLAILIHESLHGIDEACEAKMSEKQITRMAVGLAAFLIDNDLLREDLRPAPTPDKAQEAA